MCVAKPPSFGLPKNQAVTQHSPYFRAACDRAFVASAVQKNRLSNIEGQSAVYFDTLFATNFTRPMAKIEAKHAFRLRDEFEFADVALVLGHKRVDVLESRVNHASHLFHQRRLGIVLLTGGQSIRNRGDTKSEAEMMRNIAIGKGVDARHLRIENESSTTIENIRHTLAIINCCAEFRDLSSIVLISSPWHMGRVLMIAQLYLGKRARLVCSHSDDGPTWSDIRQGAQISPTVQNELRLIRYLQENGFELPKPNVV